MRRSLLTLAFVCVFAFATLGQSGGGTYETGGAQPTPTPPPCPAGEVCPGTGTNSAAPSGPDFSALFIEGVLTIFVYLP